MSDEIMNQGKPEFSVVIPAHQEAQVIEQTLSSVCAVIESLTPDFEIIVVDDGSSDGTFDKVLGYHAKDDRVKGLRLSRQFGKEAALLAGLSRARGRAVITIDGDLQHPPELIPELVEKWRQGAWIVHGVKEQRLDGSAFYQFGAHVFNRIFSRLAGFDIMGSSDYKLLDCRMVKVLAERFPEHTRFHRGLSKWVGYPQASVSYNVRPRPAGGSRWSLYSLFRYAWNTLTAYTSLPLQVVPLLGVVMLGISGLLGVQTVYSRMTGDAVSGFATLEITLLFIGSMVMIGLGVIGQYLGRIYDELKRRPVFLVAEAVGLEPDSLTDQPGE